MFAAFLVTPQLKLRSCRQAQSHIQQFERGRLRVAVKMMSPQHTTLRTINSRNENLFGLYCVPDPFAQTQANGNSIQTFSKDVIILCHGFQSSKDSPLLTYIREHLACPTFSFDFSGNGSSEGNFRYANYLSEVEDLHAVITMIRGRGGDVKGIVGHSKGGNVVLLYAQKYGNVSLVINLAGRFDMRRGVEERFGKSVYDQILNGETVRIRSERNGKVHSYEVNRSDLESRFAIDMDMVVRGIGEGVRVVTVHGERDEIIPVDDAYQIDSRRQEGRLVIIDGGDHRFRGVEDKVVSALEQELGQ